MKNLLTVQQNNKVALQKSKSLMTITSKILSKDDWIQRLWDWADENKVSDIYWIEYEEFDEGGFWSGIPRVKDELLVLQKLDMQSMQLIELPNVIGNLTKLKEICLGNNNIKLLPKEIGNLYYLDNLDLAFNSLITLPKEVGNLFNLRILMICVNELFKIPKEIGSLAKLEVFNLAHNQIKELPETIGNLTKLKLLMLSNNALSSLPDEITKLNNLETLSLESNPNLVLTDKQVIWIDSLKVKGCKVTQDEEWMRKLWKWADDNYIPGYCRYMVDGDEGYWGGLPRDQESLINLTDFSHDSDNEIFENLERPGIYKDKLEIPKEIENLVNLTEIYLTGSGLVVLPREIGNLTKLKLLTLDNVFEIPKEIESLTNLTSFTIENFDYSNKSKLVIPSEIGKLLNLERLTIYHEEGIELVLPKEIGNLTSLSVLYITASKLNLPEDITNLGELKILHLNVNTDFHLSSNQKTWILELIKNGCEVSSIDSDLMERTFGNSEFYENKFNYLVVKLSNRNEVLGKCFDRNITFNSYEDNKLIWTSIATGEDKKMLITHWNTINNFVKEIFSSETKIANIAVSIE